MNLELKCEYFFFVLNMRNYRCNMKKEICNMYITIFSTENTKNCLKRVFQWSCSLLKWLQRPAKPESIKEVRFSEMDRVIMKKNAGENIIKVKWSIKSSLSSNQLQKFLNCVLCLESVSILDSLLLWCVELKKSVIHRRKRSFS